MRLDRIRERAHTAIVKPETRTFIAAFLQGFTGAGLFHKLEIPGLPTRMFEPEPGEGEENVAREEFKDTGSRPLSGQMSDSSNRRDLR